MPLSPTVAATRYARALLDMARDQGDATLDRWAQHLGGMAQVQLLRWHQIGPE